MSDYLHDFLVYSGKWKIWYALVRVKIYRKLGRFSPSLWRRKSYFLHKKCEFYKK